jgi:hypothetical protein
MLPNKVECPRCRKPGFLTLRAVYSSHYGLIKIPYKRQKFVGKETINPAVGKGEEPTKSVDRWRVTYGPFWHFYIGHYDTEKYKKGMDIYKRGKLKSRPDGRRWCKIRYNQAKGEAQSDLQILMDKYDFNFRDVRREVSEREREFRLKKYGREFLRYAV